MPWFKRLAALVVVVAASCTGAVRTHTSATDVYARFTRHLEAGQVDSMVALFSSTARYRDHTYGIDVTGRAAIGSILDATVKSVSAREVTVRHFQCGPDTVVFEWRIDGVFAGQMLGVAPDYAPITIEGLSIGVVEDGQIVAHTDYLARAGLEQRLGFSGR